MAETATTEKPRDIGPDGEKIADMAYYDLLEVRGDASELEIKKAYRKMAIRFHPDKPQGDEEKFKMIGEAYRVLSDGNLRADYNKYGTRKPTDEVGLQEATAMFSNLFGGERFNDLIGEISLIRDFGKASEIMLSPEEKEAMEREMNAEQKKAAGETVSGETATPEVKPEAAAPAASATAATEPTGEAASAATTDAAAPKPATDSPSASSQHLAAQGAKPSTPDVKGGKPKLTPEQKQKLEELEKEKEKQEQERVQQLTRKLIDRIRPFVEAKHPGDKDDSETQLFEKKMREEAEDLKLESFGVELLHAIGNIYITKSTTWIKSRRHNFLGLPGFFSRLKEKGGMVKETWGLLGSAVSVQMSMEDIAKRQEKGDIGEEELKVLEQEMSGKMLLATWRGTRWEVNNVLRQVCDNVLNEKGVPDQVLLNRARALAFLGSIYSQVKPDEGDDERRELERLVAEAGKKKAKKAKKEKGSKVPSPAATPGAASPKA